MPHWVQLGQAAPGRWRGVLGVLMPSCPYTPPPWGGMVPVRSPRGLSWLLGMVVVRW